MRHCFRFFPAAVLLSLLVTACAPASSPDAPSLQATELGHGTSRTSVETQIQSGSLSSDNGAWLTLQVKKSLGGTAHPRHPGQRPGDLHHHRARCLRHPYNRAERGPRATTCSSSAPPKPGLNCMPPTPSSSPRKKSRGIRSPGFRGFSHSASGSSLTAVVAVSSAADEAALVAHLLLAAGLLLLALAPVQTGCRAYFPFSGSFCISFLIKSSLLICPHHPGLIP